MRAANDEDLFEYLEYLSYAGACDRYGCDPEVFEDMTRYVSVTPTHAALRDVDIRQRIDFELDVIRQAGLPGYFLIVADLLRFCRQAGIPTGPGRGSVCGSAVAYATGITDIDPLRWGIPFERFLHLERVAMPDVDLDICQARRGEVIEYLREKYGRDNVAQIITFTPMQARSVIRDVCRVLHVDDLRGTRNGESGEELARLVPEGSGADQVKLAAFLDSEDGRPLRKILEPLEVEYEGRWVSVLDTCLRLEGVAKTSSIHAAGVVIADRPLVELVPLYKRNRDAEVQIQYDMRDAEVVGLLKMDILGLRTMTVIGEAEALVRELDPDFDIKAVPLDDAATYEMLSAGDTGGVFQLEGEGVTHACIGMRPERFEDLVNLNALYRPGPMEQLGSYIARKNGEEEVTFYHEDLEPILASTYGLFVFQEQVMGAARVLGGYTAGAADMFRKAIGKKLPEVIREEIEKLKLAGIMRGYGEALMDEIGALIAYFGRYGWNLGHSTGYSFITYRTAYLKANHPVEWYAALLNSYVSDAAQLSARLREAKKRGISVLPPDINESGRFFTIHRYERRDPMGEEDAIRFGLEAVRGVGESVVVDILEERDSTTKNSYVVERQEKFKPDGTPYKGSTKRTIRVPHKPRLFGGSIGNVVLDFCARLPSVPVNVKQALAVAGAFGTDAEFRRRLHAAMPELNKAAKSGKGFDLDAWEGDTMSDLELLREERQVVGFYVTGHPLELYEDQLAMYDAVTDGEFENLPQSFTVAGLVLEVRTHQSARGEMAWVKVENGILGMPEITVFSDVWRQVKDAVTQHAVIVAKGKRDEHPKFGVGFKAEMVQVVSRSRAAAKLVRVVMPPEADEADIDILASFLVEDDGPVWHLVVCEGPRAALLVCEGAAIPTGAVLSAFRELGWTVQLDPDRNTRIQIGGAIYAPSDQTHGTGRRGGREAIWDLPLVSHAIRALNVKVLGELRQT